VGGCFSLLSSSLFFHIFRREGAEAAGFALLPACQRALCGFRFTFSRALPLSPLPAVPAWCSVIRFCCYRRLVLVAAFTCSSATHC